ncbi:BatA domain-containing protein [Runella sp. MFBS21]|uniref:BatA domain-containing protein n=1 Tax=Runella sp. MFBS21 TaxID=3034018 RepID=UPI0023F6A3A9|nr:BatA domain-containing protein [Runella sp. MFBS21]MDF7820915.1 BatA domain-containing protein [Runella sp. MFBS21]
MEFLNPLMLWSALAVAIPIALHFWHQKKGKLLPWAATQWLIEKDLQPAKGIRLDNILLLLLRCLLLLLLAFYLAKPILKNTATSDHHSKIHLVQPSEWVVNNFRFEIEGALTKGEKVYWISDAPTPLENLTAIPTVSDFDPLVLQTFLNEVDALHSPEKGIQYELYMTNDVSFGDASTIYTSSPISLHSVVDSSQKVLQNYLSLTNNKKVFVNNAQLLTVGDVLPSNLKFANTAVHQGVIEVLLDTKDSLERQTIKAAFESLKDVYQLEFLVDEHLQNSKKYDIVLTDNNALLQNQTAFTPQTLCFVLGNATGSFAELNQERFREVVSLSERLTPQTSEMVYNGQLPEWLGEWLVKDFGLNRSRALLSAKQLQSIFKVRSKGNQALRQKSAEGVFSTLILLLLVLIVIIERWLSITKKS